jgi:orotate phosphoribosyltransferase-like protein
MTDDRDDNRQRVEREDSRDDERREGRGVVSRNRRSGPGRTAVDDSAVAGGQYQEFIEKIKHPKCADLARARPGQP